MSRSLELSLQSFSEALVSLTAESSKSVAAVHASASRSVSAIAIADSLIATTSHTLRHEGPLPVTLPDGSITHATIAGRAPSLDVAILKLDGAQLPQLPLAGIDNLQAGALAVAVGRAADVGPISSLGIISAAGPARRTWRGGSLDRFFKLDVAIYPSLSGGAIVDAERRLIGMATNAFTRSSALAIPASNLQKLADELLKEGRLRRGYLGIGLQPIPVPEYLSNNFSWAKSNGLIVLSVEQDSPASKAGLQLGDIIVGANERPVVENEDLLANLSGEAIGQRLSLAILRGGLPVTIDITVAERERRAR